MAVFLDRDTARMPITTRRAAFWKGCRESTPFFLVSCLFGLLFGVLAAEAGLGIIESMAFTVLLFAGSVQFTALQLMQEQAPVLIVLVSALAVNLRVTMYSAALTPQLGQAPGWQRALIAYFLSDHSYAMSNATFEQNPLMPLPLRIAFYAGSNSLVLPGWVACTFLGARFGASIPASWGMEFALPLAFIAMLGPMLRSPAHRMACLVASLVCLPATLLPYNLGMIVAGVSGMIAGAKTEQWLTISHSMEQEG